MVFITQHKLVVAFIAIVVIGVGWYTLSGSSSSPTPSLTTSGARGDPSSTADRTLVSTLLALRSVKLEATILSDPLFLSLKDFSTQIVPEPVGRVDPFAPLSVSPSNSASSSHNAQIFSPRR